MLSRNSMFQGADNYLINTGKYPSRRLHCPLPAIPSLKMDFRFVVIGLVDVVLFPNTRLYEPYVLLLTSILYFQIHLAA